MNIIKNWRLKAIVQTFISFIPFGLRINFLLQKINGGFSDENLLGNFTAQSKRMGFIKSYFYDDKFEGKIVVDVGPGWYAITGVIFYLLDCKKYIV